VETLLVFGCWLLVAFSFWLLAIGQKPSAKSQKLKAFPLNSSMSQKIF